jgi:MoxR-like ATPase
MTSAIRPTPRPASHRPPATATPTIASIQAKFAATRLELGEAIIEKEPEVDMLLTALVAQEHALIISPPGAAKSLLGASLARWFGCRPFYYCLNKFTEPNELFGQYSIKHLKDDRYHRLTADMLPEAEIATLDEIWKCSSAIANTVLTILNERTFKNGTEDVCCPLRMLMAFSNEWPTAENGGKELGALFDRFLFRKSAKYVVSEEGEQALLWRKDHTPHLSTTLTLAELDMATAAAGDLPWSEDAMAALGTLLKELRNKAKIFPSDRRKVKSPKAVQAYAFLAGATCVEPEHLAILEHVLWDDPAEQPGKCAEVVARVANPIGPQIARCRTDMQAVLRDYDPRDRKSVGYAVSALGEIHTKLAKWASDPRANALQARVTHEIAGINLKSASDIHGMV